MQPEAAAQLATEPRLQGVAYLNAWPVLYGLMLGREPERLRMAVPAVLAQRLVAREVDVALAPVATLAMRGGFELAPGICIGCDGPVTSVLVVAERPLEDLQHLLLDSASRSSVVLARLVLEHLRRGRPLSTEVADPARIERETSGATGAVVIGDRALLLAGRYPHVLDLGEAWHAWTGLPFVFAAWIAQEGVLTRSVLSMLDRSLELGLSARRDIAHLWAAQHGGDPQLFERYLTNHVRYRLDGRFACGMREFFARAARAGLLPEVQVRFAESA